MIYVLDSIMGSGKTKGFIRKVQEGEIREPFLYVSPCKEEVDGRIPKNLSEFHVVSPMKGKKKGDTKSSALLRLLNEGRNVACTHELLRHLTSGALSQLIQLDYTIIIDEAVQTYQTLDVPARDVKMMLEGGQLIHKEGTNEVTWDFNTYGDYDGRLSDVKEAAELGTLLLTPRFKLLVWAYPTELFTCGLNIYVMTYLFKNSMMDVWMGMNHLDYQMTPPEGWVDRSEESIKAEVRTRLHIYDGPNNDVGKRKGGSRMLPINDTTLSSTNLEDSAKRRELLLAARNVLDWNFKASCGSTLFTTIKKEQGPVYYPKGYKEAFRPCNLRAVDDLKGRTSVAYCLNLFVNEDLKDLIKDGPVEFDHLQYALSEAIQFIWRGCIRVNPEDYLKDHPNGKREAVDMNLYIPSIRMRHLLLKWLGYSEEELF